MQLYCKDGIVVAWYDDGVSVPMGAHPGTYVVNYAGGLSSLARAGDPIEGGPDLRPFRAPALDLTAYAAAKRYAVETGGVEVGGVMFATDDRAKTLLLGARAAAQADPAYTTTWYAADGSAHTLKAADLIAISNAVLAHVNAAFADYGAVLAGLAATPPTITTPAQVDAVFAASP